MSKSALLVLEMESIHILIWVDLMEEHIKNSENPKEFTEKFKVVREWPSERVWKFNLKIC
jgi:hypothetical protein